MTTRPLAEVSTDTTATDTATITTEDMATATVTVRTTALERFTTAKTQKALLETMAELVELPIRQRQEIVSSLDNGYMLAMATARATHPKIADQLATMHAEMSQLARVAKTADTELDTYLRTVQHAANLRTALHNVCSVLEMKPLELASVATDTETVSEMAKTPTGRIRTNSTKTKTERWLPAVGMRFASSTNYSPAGSYIEYLGNEKWNAVTATKKATVCKSPTVAHEAIRHPHAATNTCDPYKVLRRIGDNVKLGDVAVA